MESWNGSVSVVGADDAVGGGVAADDVDAEAEADVGIAVVVSAGVAVVVDASADSLDAPVDGISALCDHSQKC